MGIFTVVPGVVAPGEEVVLTITATDDIDVQHVAAHFHGRWHTKLCGGIQHTCTRTWTFTETTPGTFIYHGSILDSINQWQKANPHFIFIDVLFLNQPPEVRNPLIEADHCRAPGRYIFSWTFYDPNPGDTQSMYQVQVATHINFDTGVLVIDETVSSSFPSFAPLHLFEWDTKYYWRVRVRDNHGARSEWSAITSFITPTHTPPQVDFSWEINEPVIGEVIEFIDNSICFGPGDIETDCASWEWDFNNDGVIDSTIQNPTTTAIRNMFTRLAVTDPTGYTCYIIKDIDILGLPPEWIEIPPF